MEVRIMQSVLRVVLVDINPKVVNAWRSAFDDIPEVEIVHGSILDQSVDAWVTPTNARGRMNGGVDAVIKHYLGSEIQKRVRREITRLYQGVLPVGHATCVETGATIPRFLISVPTMIRSAENISHTNNVALACAAAFLAIRLHNELDPDSITSVALPGLGAATGRVPPEVCARLMRAGYHLVQENHAQILKRCARFYRNNWFIHELYETGTCLEPRELVSLLTSGSWPHREGGNSLEIWHIFCSFLE